MRPVRERQRIKKKMKSLLFTPLQVRGVTLRNRIVVSPMLCGNQRLRQ
jgi:2,4-dienoyl-CoA reductase-like NADH-dependent reductase (Old Yellow Enzyme family)